MTFDFAEWLAGVEEPAEAVTIYQKPGLVAQIAALQESLPPEGAKVERGLGDADPQQKLKDLREALAASRTVWYVSPLTREDEQAIEAAFPEPAPPPVFPDDPPQLATRATEAQSRAFTDGWAAWQEAKGRWEAEHADQLTAWKAEAEDVSLKRGAARLAQSISWIEAGGQREQPHLTGDDILALERKLGQPQISLLVEALDRVNSEPPAEPDPTS